MSRPEPKLVRDGEREFWSTGWHVLRWIEEWLVFTNGRWLGQPFRLLPWQRRLILELFEVDADTGRRIYRSALIGLARKSGKTELAAALALYLAWADGEPAAEVYCAAASEKQADRVFEAVRRMVELGPLREYAVLPGPRVTQPRIYLREDPYSYVQRLSSRGSTAHGLNAHGVILDELHVWATGEAEELWAALTTSSAAREQPLQIAITTAGWDLDSRCGKLYRLGREIEAGLRPHGGFFFRWWQAPPHLDWRSPETWRLSSPSFGVIVGEDYYRSQLHLPEASFRRLYLNQWTAAESSWLRSDEWDACRLPGVGLEPGRPTYVGWDASLGLDATAVVACQWQEIGGERRWVVVPRIWQRPLAPDGSPVASWRMPRDEVVAYVEELCERYPVVGVAYDPAYIAWITAELEARGLPLVRWPQSTSRMVPATQATYELVAAGVLAHPGDPRLDSHVAAAAAKAVPSGGVRIVKLHEGAAIDGAVAMVMATGLMRDLERSRSAADEEVAIYIPTAGER